MALLVLSVLTALCSCSTSTISMETEEKEIKTAIKTYEDFLNGSVAAKNEVSTIYISDVVTNFDTGEYSDLDQYVLIDMNGDGIPELHVRSVLYI